MKKKDLLPFFYWRKMSRSIVAYELDEKHLVKPTPIFK